MAKLTDWAVSIPSPYRAPEARGQPTVVGVLVGEHPAPLAGSHGRFQAGDRIISSGIVEAQGRVFKTKRSTYEVEGPPNAEFLAECKRQGLTLDLDNPLAAYFPVKE